jgi:hypothetical protein
MTTNLVPIQSKTYSMYRIDELSKKLAETAEEMLPAFSGQNKLLQIIIQFNYGKFDEGWLSGKEDSQHIKIVFWRPNNAMLVGYSYERHIDDIPDSYIISANHSSTWKHDGLNFFHEILEQPENWQALTIEVVDICDPIAAKEFTFTPIAAMA